MKTFEELIDLIEKYQEDVQLVLLDTFSYFSSRNSADYISVEWNKKFTPIVSEIFLVIDEEYYHLNHIVALMKKLDSISFPFPQTLKRNKDGSLSAMAKREWCRNNKDIVTSYYPEAEYKLYAKVRPTVQAFKYVHDICEYLERKFVDEKQIHIVNGKRYEFVSPSGSKVINYEKLEFDFPNDQITELLNYYSANRCISKKTGAKIIEPYFPIYRYIFSN